MILALTPIGAGASFPGKNGQIIFEKGFVALASMEPNGTDVRRITDGYEASWAPDGSRFVFTDSTAFGPDEEDTTDLFISDADGSNVTRLANTLELERFAAFGPDGNQVVYSRYGSVLYTIDLSTLLQTRLTKLQVDATGADWSVDDVIVFERFSHGDSGLFTIRPDGINLTRLSKNRGYFDIDPSWSPDGTEIVFSRCSRSHWRRCDLFTMNADGSDKDRVTDTKATDQRPSSHRTDVQSCFPASPLRVGFRETSIACERMAAGCGGSRTRVFDGKTLRTGSP